MSHNKTKVINTPTIEEVTAGTMLLHEKSNQVFIAACVDINLYSLISLTGGERWTSPKNSISKIFEKSYKDFVIVTNVMIERADQ